MPTLSPDPCQAR